VIVVDPWSVAYNEQIVNGVTPLLYVCTRCLTPAAEPDSCSYCGGQKRACRTGEEGDPRRRPLIDWQGRVLTRAPIWWLDTTVPQLLERLS
jgi:hypothetical protein